MEKEAEGKGQRVVDLLSESSEFTTERITFGMDSYLGYLVQREFFRFFDEDGELTSTREYRVTMLFTLEPDGWKIQHRHADLSTEWAGME